MDIKSFPTDSYHKYKYLIIFLDDFTSMAWTIPLRAKSAALTATCQFLQMVKMQFQASVNGHAERFMHTLMDKAKAMRHLACLPDSWWEFATAHATHIYNRTPLSCLQWHTPYEALHSKQPQVDHLHIFGCTTYVFLPTDVRADKLAPKLELMVISYSCTPPTMSSSLLCKPSFQKRNSLNVTDLSKDQHKFPLTHLWNCPLRHQYHSSRILLLITSLISGLMSSNATCSPNIH